MPLKKEIMEEIEEIVGRMIEEKGGEEGLTLSEIEEMVMKGSQQIQEEITRQLVKANENQLERPASCPGCGGKLRNKGQAERTVVTRTGEVRIKRTYWYCESCQQGFFPPG